MFLCGSVVYSLQINALLCYTLVSALVLGIGISSGQYWYCFNPEQSKN